MTDLEQKPRLRFKGFTEAWEQRKLGDIGKTFTGLSGKTSNDFGHGDAKFLPYLNIFNNPIADVSFLESTEIDKSQNEIEYGDVFFTTSSETPDEVGMSSVWLGNGENIYLNSFCFGFRPSIDFNSYYFGYLLRSDTFRKPVTILAQGISRFNISKNKVMEIEIPLPKKKEQERIGQLFYRLDSLITLHQRKYEKLKSMKAALLEKMFPSENETTPKIRFKGFTEAWEQRPLSDYLDVSVVRNENDEFNRNSVLSVSREFGVLNQIEFQGRSFAGASLKNYKVIDKHQVVYTKSPLKANPYGIIQSSRENCGILSTLYAVFKVKNNSNSEFIEQYFALDARLNNYLYPLVNKGAKNTLLISDEDSLKGDVTFPTNSLECKQISSLIDNLDSLITLHQRKQYIKLTKP